MTSPVKGKRSYHSPRRQQQAEATKETVLRAAQHLFEQQGFPATTMEAVAAEAGVSPKTVYLAFANKSGLLRALWALLLKGDQDESGVADRPWYRNVLEEPDPERKLRLLAHASCEVKRRIGGILRVIRTAAPVDAESAALWSLIQTDFYENQKVVVATLADAGALRADLDVSRATDILWTMNHPDTWLLLVGERGWSPEQFEQWFAETIAAQLLAGDT